MYPRRSCYVAFRNMPRRVGRCPAEDSTILRKISLRMTLLVRAASHSLKLLLSSFIVGSDFEELVWAICRRLFALMGFSPEQHPGYTKVLRLDAMSKMTLPHARSRPHRQPRRHITFNLHIRAHPFLGTHLVFPFKTGTLKTRAAHTHISSVDLNPPAGSKGVFVSSSFVW